MGPMYLYDDIDQRLVDERVAQFRGQTRRFLAGELSEDDFRQLRLRNGLYVQRKTSSSFEVRELQKGASAVGFSYRIVARRRDVKGKRLEIVELGRLPEKADAMLATPKPSGQESKGRLADELAALAKQGKQKKK